mgnify:CR=1 FL=1
MNRIIILVIFLSFTTSLQAQSVESDELFSKGVELYNLKRYNEAISYFNKSNNIDKALLDTTNSRLRDVAIQLLYAIRENKGGPSH